MGEPCKHALTACVTALIVSFGTPSAERFTIAGVVVDDGGAKIRAAKVAVVTELDGPAVRSVDVSDDGTFVLTVESGVYLLRASASGYVAGIFGAERPGQLGTAIVVGSASPQVPVRIVMFRGATITGRVTVQNAAIQGVMVAALRRKNLKSEIEVVRGASSITNDLGRFQIAGLAPGRYLVLAVPTNAARPRANREGRGARSFAVTAEERLLPMYFPARTDAAGAAELWVDAGSSLNGVDIDLSYLATGAIQGRVEPVAMLGDNGATVTLRRIDMMPFAMDRTAPITPEGTFSFTGVAEGRYVLVAANARSTSRPVSLEVVADRVTSATLMRLIEKAVVSGHVRSGSAGTMPQAATTAGVRVRLESVDFEGLAYVKTLGSGGEFRFDISPGRYRLTATRGQTVLRLQNTAEPGDPSRLVRELNLESGRVLELPLITDRRGGVVRGVLRTRDGLATSRGFIVIVPIQDGENLIARQTRPDTAGAFTFTDLRAGEYLLYVLDDILADAHEDLEFLRTLRSVVGSVAVRVDAERAIEIDLTRK